MTVPASLATFGRSVQRSIVSGLNSKFHWRVNYNCIRELGLTNLPAVTATRHYELAGRLLSPLGPDTAHQTFFVELRQLAWSSRTSRMSKVNPSPPRLSRLMGRAVFTEHGRLVRLAAESPLRYAYWKPSAYLRAMP